MRRSIRAARSTGCETRRAARLGARRGLAAIRRLGARWRTSRCRAASTAPIDLFRQRARVERGDTTIDSLQHEVDSLTTLKRRIETDPAAAGADRA